MVRIPKVFTQWRDFDESENEALILRGSRSASDRQEFSKNLRFATLDGQFVYLRFLARARVFLKSVRIVRIPDRAKSVNCL